jgi:hypothetical protein
MKTTSIQWRRATRARSGSRRWLSACGRYMIAASELCYGIPLDPVWYTAFVRVTVQDIGRRFDSWRRISVVKYSKVRRRHYRQDKFFTRQGAIRAVVSHTKGRV